MRNHREWQNEEEKETYEKLWKKFRCFTLPFLRTLPKDQYQFVLDVRGVVTGGLRDADSQERIKLYELIKENPSWLQNLLEKQFYCLSTLDNGICHKEEVEEHKRYIEGWRLWWFLNEESREKAIPLIKEYSDVLKKLRRERDKMYFRSQKKEKEYSERYQALLGKIEELEISHGNNTKHS